MGAYEVKFLYKTLPTGLKEASWQDGICSTSRGMSTGSGCADDGSSSGRCWTQTGWNDDGTMVFGGAEEA